MRVDFQFQHPHIKGCSHHHLHLYNKEMLNKLKILGLLENWGHRANFQSEIRKDQAHPERCS